MVFSNYQRVIDTIVQEYDELFVAINDTKKQKNIENATGQSLDYYGTFLNVPRMYGETDVDYLNRLLTYISSIKESTTKGAIKDFLSNFLGVNESNIVICEDTPYYLSIVLPSEYSDEEADLKKYIKQIIAAGMYVHFEFTNSIWDSAEWDNDTYKWG